MSAPDCAIWPILSICVVDVLNRAAEFARGPTLVSNGRSSGETGGASAARARRRPAKSARNYKFISEWLVSWLVVVVFVVVGRARQLSTKADSNFSPLSIEFCVVSAVVVVAAAAAV
jgi:hypothetical protein